MLDSLRPFLTRILNPLVRKTNITPNIITIISPFIALLAAYFFSEKSLIFASIAILFSGFLDILDGSIARYYKKTSEFGGFLDSTIDRISDGIIIIGIIFGGYCNWFIGILALHSGIMVSYVRARAESQGVKCNVGIAERATRLLIIVFGAIIEYLTKDIYFEYILIILVVLSYLTFLQRVIYTWNKLK